MSVTKLILLALLFLFVFGVVIGPIGAAILGRTPFVPLPDIHLPPDPVLRIGGFVVTNTLLSAWLTTIVILLLFILGTRKNAEVPGRLQGFIEVIVEALYGFMKGVAGETWARRFFPVLATIFLFVALNAWMPLLPFYPALYFGDPAGYHLHLLRGAGTDINMPLALALISFVFFESWGFRAHRWGYLKEFIRLGNPILFFVGLIELLSHLIRIMSFTIRLFGNMIAAKGVLSLMTFVLIFIAPVAIYGLELLLGGVQALIFMGLTLVFATMAVATHGEHEHGEEHPEAVPAHGPEGGEVR